MKFWAGELLLTHSRFLETDVLASSLGRTPWGWLGAGPVPAEEEALADPELALPGAARLLCSPRLKGTARQVWP